MDWRDYTEAKFTTVMEVIDPDSTTTPPGMKWIAGFFCQGPESIVNDGNVCYTNEQNQNTFTRSQKLSPLEDDPETAIAEAYILWKIENP